MMRVATIAASVGAVALMSVAPSDAEQVDESAPVVLVGASGLTWDDIDNEHTPALATLMQSAAIGQISVRAVYPVTCPVDAWLTVSAARRAASERTDDPGDKSPAIDQLCPAIPSVAGGRVDGWAGLQEFNNSLSFGAQLGLLGTSGAAAGRTILSAGPGALVAGANESGFVSKFVDDPLDVTASDLKDSDIALLDLGGISDHDDGTRAAQVGALDDSVGRILSIVPEGATVILVAVANSRPTADLQVIAASGDAFAPGLLTSTSTRQEGLVLLTDITPTLFALAGIPASDDFVGAPIESVPGDPGATFEDKRQNLVDQTRKVDVSGDVAAPFFIAVTGAQLLFYGLALWVLRRRQVKGDPQGRLLPALGGVAMVGSAIPAGTFLANVAPWWHWHPAHVTLAGLVLVWALVIAAAAGWLGRGGRPLAKVGIVAAITSVVLTADIVSGGHLQVASLMGYSPVIGGRLYGFGNVAFALFATSLLFVAAWCGGMVVERRGGEAASVVVLLIGVAGLIVDGLPSFGSDFGGVLALATGFGVFFLAARGVRITVLRLLATLGVGLVVVSVVSVVDWLRPPDSRSHLGTFVQQVIDGELLDVVNRKFTSNVDMLVTGPLTVLVPLAFLALAVVLLRRTGWTPEPLLAAYERAPLLRPAMIGWVTIMVVGFALNDSGAAIPAVGLMLTVPFLIVIGVEIVRGRRLSELSTSPADRDSRRAAH